MARSAYFFARVFFAFFAFAAFFAFFAMITLQVGVGESDFTSREMNKFTARPEIHS